MRRIWESIGAIIVTAFAIHLLYELVKPYALLIVIALLLFFIGGRVYSRARRG